MLIVFTDVCKLRGGYRVAGQVAWCEAEQKGGIGRGGGMSATGQQLYKENRICIDI